MKKVSPQLIARLALGAMFFIFGLNGFLGFIRLGTTPPPAANFMMAMVHTGYLFYFVKGTEVVAGTMLLIGLFPALALVILAPITLNILLFNLFLNPHDIGLAVVLILLQGFLAYSYREKYTPLFKK